MDRRDAVDAGRRAFLRGGRVSTPMRPPWAREERDFLDRCTRCDDCIRACPEVILQRGDGGYPEVRFDGAECTFCGACVEVCASGALEASRAPPWDWIADAGAACLTREGVVCQSCRDACGPRAIVFSARDAVPAPHIDASRCNGCGACLGVCPTSALSLVRAAAVGA